MLLLLGRHVTQEVHENDLHLLDLLVQFPGVVDSEEQQTIGDILPPLHGLPVDNVQDTLPIDVASLSAIPHPQLDASLSSLHKYVLLHAGMALKFHHRFVDAQEWAFLPRLLVGFLQAGDKFVDAVRLSDVFGSGSLKYSS